MPGFFRMRLLRTLRGWLPQYRENLSLAVPVMLSQVGQVVVQLFDNAMVGRLGALPLAAVSFGGAVFVIFLFWGTGLSMGLTPLVGEMYARRDYRSSARLLQNALTLYGGVGIVLFAILWVLGDFLGSMGQSPEVAELARPYYGYLAWSVVPFMLFAAFKQFLEGIGNTITGMVVVLTANGVNILFNYLLIYGHWGFPEMGAAGAGLGHPHLAYLHAAFYARLFPLRTFAAALFPVLCLDCTGMADDTAGCLRVGLPISAANGARSVGFRTHADYDGNGSGPCRWQHIRWCCRCPISSIWSWSAFRRPRRSW